MVLIRKAKGKELVGEARRRVSMRYASKGNALLKVFEVDGTESSLVEKHMVHLHLANFSGGSVHFPLLIIVDSDVIFRPELHLKRTIFLICANAATNAEPIYDR